MEFEKGQQIQSLMVAGEKLDGAVVYLFNNWFPEEVAGMYLVVGHPTNPKNPPVFSFDGGWKSWKAFRISQEQGDLFLGSFPSDREAVEAASSHAGKKADAVKAAQLKEDFDVWGALPKIKFTQFGAGKPHPFEVFVLWEKRQWYPANSVDNPSLIAIMQLDELRGFRFTGRMKFCAARAWVARWPKGSGPDCEPMTWADKMAQDIMNSPDPKKTPCHFSRDGRIFEKVSYGSESAAVKAAAKMPTEGLSSYPCPRCQKWHLTSSPK